MLDINFLRAAATQEQQQSINPFAKARPHKRKLGLVNFNARSREPTLTKCMPRVPSQATTPTFALYSATWTNNPASIFLGSDLERSVTTVTPYKHTSKTNSTLSKWFQYTGYLVWLNLTVPPEKDHCLCNLVTQKQTKANRTTHKHEKIEHRAGNRDKQHI